MVKFQMFYNLYEYDYFYTMKRLFKIRKCIISVLKITYIFG